MRQYYGYALIAGIHREEARHTEPGFILDMYLMRARYDAQMAVGRIRRRTGLG